MIPDEARSIVEGLHEKSRQGQVNWQYSEDVGVNAAPGGQDYLLTMPNYSINFWLNSRTDTITFAVYNAAGQTIYRFNTTTEEEEDYALLKELIDLAARKAMNVDEALASLRYIISQPGEVGEIVEPSEPQPEDEIPF